MIIHTVFVSVCFSFFLFLEKKVKWDSSTRNNCQNISGWAWKLSQSVSQQAGADLGPGSELAWTQGWTPRKEKGWEQRLRTGAAGMEGEKGRGAHWLRG